MMKLSAPTQIVFLISLVLAVLAIVATYVTPIPYVSGNAFVVAIVAYVLLFLGNILKGF